MDGVIVWVARYLIWVMCGGLALCWLVAERGMGRVQVALAAVLGLALTVALIAIAGHLHTDPRPFVQDPGLRPLIEHAADNGFPSDHASAAGLIAALALVRRRWFFGLLLGACAVAVSAARVAAHVHHVQDVVAGLLIGAFAAAVAVWVAGWVCTRLVAWRAGRPADSVQ